MAKNDDKDPTEAVLEGSGSLRKLAEWKERLAVHLTREEIEDQRKAALDFLRDLDQLAEQLKTATQDIKAEIQTTKSKLGDARAAVDRGWIMREITVERFVNRKGEVTEIRIDTGDVLRRRPANADERQELLDLDRNSKAKADEQKKLDEKQKASATKASPPPAKPTGKDAAAGEKPDDGFGPDEPEKKPTTPTAAAPKTPTAPTPKKVQ